MTGQSNLMWPNLEQMAHGDASWSETGASPSEPLQMLSRSSRRFSTSVILSIHSKAYPSPLILCLSTVF